MFLTYMNTPFPLIHVDKQSVNYLVVLLQLLWQQSDEAKGERKWEREVKAKKGVKMDFNILNKQWLNF